MRIALMVIRLFLKAPYYLFRIWYCGVSKKISYEESFQIIKKVTKKANHAGRVEIKVHGLENIPDQDGFIFFLTIRVCLMYLYFWIHVQGLFLLWRKKKQVILSF